MKQSAKKLGTLVSIAVFFFAITGYELYRYQNIFFFSSQQQAPEPATTQPPDARTNEIQALGPVEVSYQEDYSKVDIAELTSRVEALFSTSDIQSRTSATTTPLDLDQIMDPRRNEEFLEVQYWIGLAVDLGISLEPLSPYGVEALESGRYKIDLKKYPEWVMNHVSLQQFLDKENRPALFQSFLFPMGFTQDDLNALETYVDSRAHPNLAVARAVLAVMDAEYARIKSLQLDPQANTEVYRSSFFRLNYLANRVSQRIWMDWGLGLLNSLSPEGQEILVRFARESAIQRTLIPSMPEDFIEIYIQELQDNKHRDEQVAQIAALEDRANVR
jgi:hypothetical protein